MSARIASSRDSTPRKARSATFIRTTSRSATSSRLPNMRAPWRARTRWRRSPEPLQPGGDRAAQAGGIVDELRLAPEVADQEIFQKPAAEALPDRRGHGRAIAFLPGEMQLIVVHAPMHGAAALRARQRAVFGRVCSELVQRQRQG